MRGIFSQHDCEQRLFKRLTVDFSRFEGVDAKRVAQDYQYCASSVGDGLRPLAEVVCTSDEQLEWVREYCASQCDQLDFAVDPESRYRFLIWRKDCCHIKEEFDRQQASNTQRAEQEIKATADHPLVAEQMACKRILDLCGHPEPSCYQQFGMGNLFAYRKGDIADFRHRLESHRLCVERSFRLSLSLSARGMPRAWLSVKRDDGLLKVAKGEQSLVCTVCDARMLSQWQSSIDRFNRAAVLSGGEASCLSTQVIPSETDTDQFLIIVSSPLGSSQAEELARVACAELDFAVVDTPSAACR